MRTAPADEGAAASDLAEESGIHIRADKGERWRAFKSGRPEIDRSVHLKGVAIARGDVEDLPLLTW